MYYGASSELTALAGAGENVFNNANCVIIKVKAESAGLQLSAPGAASMEVSFED